MRGVLLAALVTTFLTMVAAAAAQTIVVDDASPGCRLEGVWADSKSAGWSSGGTVGGGYRYTSVHPPARKTGKERATWTPSLPKAGSWRVEVSYRASENRAGKVTYEVKGRDATRSQRVNQRQGTDMTWAQLGTHVFEMGTSGSVAMVSDGGGSAAADAVRFTFASGDSSPCASGTTSGGAPGLDDVISPGKAKAIRLTANGPNEATYTFTADGTASVTALLATYGPASLSVKVKRKTGAEEGWMSWERANDRDPAPLQLEGKAVPESIVESSPGDPSAVAVTRQLKGAAGDRVFLRLKGQFGRGEALLELMGTPAPATAP